MARYEYEINLKTSLIKFNDLCCVLNKQVLDFGSPGNLVKFILSYIPEMIRNAGDKKPTVALHMVNPPYTYGSRAIFMENQCYNLITESLYSLLSETRSPYKIYILNQSKNRKCIDLYLFSDDHAMCGMLIRHIPIQVKMIDENESLSSHRYLTFLTSDDTNAFSLSDYECKINGYRRVYKTVDMHSNQKNNIMKKYGDNDMKSINEHIKNLVKNANNATDTINERIENLVKNTNNTAETIFGVPKIIKVVYNGPATIVKWGDGTKTVVKCTENDTFSYEVGLAMAISKKALGNNSSWYNYFDRQLKKAIAKTTEDKIK